MQLPERYEENMRALLTESEYEQYITSFSEESHRGIRFNPLKVSAEEQREVLETLGLSDAEQVPWSGGFGYYDRGSENIAKHPWYYGGLYYIQEPSAMAPAALLPIEEGDRVLDLCAAPGGKSTLLGARLSRKGLLLANDISTSRARALLKNIEMAGIPNVLVSAEDPENLRKNFRSFFDKILIDAPCSGEGMFRREPSMTKSWEEKGPEYYAAIQKTLLDTAAELLKPGGMLLYSTCTFSPLEDEENIRSFLSEHEEMEGVRLPEYEGFTYLEQGTMAKLYPWNLKGEGHFAALLRKKGASAPSAKEDFSAENRKFLKKHAELSEFLSLISASFPENGHLWEKDGAVYLLPAPREQLGRIRYLRTGLLLGEEKKGRFEPSQALAMALQKEEFSQTVDFPAGDQRVIRYLKGETITCEDAEVRGKDGWCLILAGSHPLGFAKRNKSQLKNKYYPGWRWQ